ncbi:MAG: ABC transporter ATP-binding protein [Coriobacteriia bacterium]|nr:ABC transporter ATP-binding protein [Coriobacteriia bacterium]
MTTASAITVQKMSKVFGQRKALDKVSFELPQGAFLSIFGPNGAGKTTLLRILSTLMRPSSGSAEVLGFDLKEKPGGLRNHIGFISHKPLLYLDLSAEENLLFAARLYGVEEPEQRVSELLAVVELTARRHDSVRTFSRGMTQRLSIARALVHDPQLVFLDEPYSGLDPHAVHIFDELLQKIREQESLERQRSFCMVSHDMDKGLDLATHLLILEKGKVVLFDQKDEIDRSDFVRHYHRSVGMGVA